MAMHAVTLLVLSIVSFGSPKAMAPHHFAGSHVTAIRPAAPDKVWTNDDVKTLRQQAPISIVGTVETFESTTSFSAPDEMTTELRRYVKEQDPEWYAQEIEARRIEIASAEAQMAQIAETEKTGTGISGVVPLDKNSPGILLPGTIWVLEHEDIEARNEINELQDLGRQSGIAAAAWR
jgi:hypothetical protein